MPESKPPEIPGRKLAQVAASEGIATPEFVAALLADGDDDLAAWALGQALEEQPRALAFDGVVRPAMELVGARWESGQWSISQEHLASNALAAALARLRPQDSTGVPIGPVAVLAAPEGEEHVIGLACLAQVFEERGWRAENLGANVPAGDLQRFVAGRDVAAVALSVGTRARVPALGRAIEALRAVDADGRHVPIMVGGHGIAGVEQEIQGADFVGASLADAVRFIDALGERLQSGLE
jgi:MerR family transcriptional regulator, light-induced transcriptional regulator